MRTIVDSNCVAHVFKIGQQELRVAFHHGSVVVGDLFISLDQAMAIAEFVNTRTQHAGHAASGLELK